MNLFFFVCGSLVLILSSNLAIEIRPMISRSRVYRTLPHTFASFSAKARKTKSFVQSAAAGYDHLEVERRWQQYWDDNEIFVSKRRKGHPKKYVLDMFPYPSGSGLHVGHPEGYTATDIMARYWRMCGFDVLHPMGWDAFGLPAEQHAINTGTHPAVTTHDNIATFKRQLKSLGFSYDWSRELSTTDDDYVRWTQWIFLQLFHRGLAAQSEISVNWCPALGTVLANEEIINGLSERGSHPVVRQPLRQWVLKITEYADKLEEGLVGLNWPEGTLSAQKQWIGKSQGASVKFKVDASTLDISYKDKAKNVHSNSKLSEGAFAESCGRIESIEVFTTRADTLMGVTYLVLAPEHPLVAQLTSDAQRSAVHAYLASTAGKSDLERTSVGRDRGKTGVSLGSCARHPLTGQPVPIWIADYVLASYGTGAVMAVPAHDERDFEFASIFGLDIKQVVMPVPSQVEDVSSASASTDSAAAPELQLPYTGAGVTVNSGDEFNGLDSASCQQAVMRKLSDVGAGGPTITYKLRDWVFSRQRYWGEPIPIYFPVEMLTVDGSGSPVEGAQHRICYEQPIPVPEAELPLRLPDMTDFQPGSDPQGCLSRATHWRYFQQDGKWFARETNTMPQWAGSCWYYLRFADPRNTQELIGAEGRSWLPVDLYVGGQEHAVLHLLYARFWHKALYDAGVVDHPEPFTRLVHQGMILGGDGEKMSKSRGNVINPDDVVQQYGADALRLYEMFMGPLEAVKPWQTEQLMGVVRFRDKVLGLAGGPVKEAAAEGNVLREMHRTIKKVTQDIERLGFNTAISNLMIFANLLISVRKGSSTGAVREEGPSEVPPREAVEALVLLLSPFAPHAAEECWRMLGHTQSLAHFPWPQYIEELCKESTATVVLQVNGKVRGKLDAAKDAPLESLLKEALLQPSVARFTEGMQIKKKIYVPGKVLNLIV